VPQVDSRIDVAVGDAIPPREYGPLTIVDTVRTPGVLPSAFPSTPTVVSAAEADYERNLANTVELLRSESLEIVSGRVDPLPQLIERDFGVCEARWWKIGQSSRGKFSCVTRALDLAGEGQHVRRQSRAWEDAYIEASRFGVGGRLVEQHRQYVEAAKEDRNGRPVNRESHGASLREGKWIPLASTNSVGAV